MVESGAMNRRNLFWLVAIVVAGGVVWLLAGWVWGVLAGVATLVASEVVERRRRSRRRAARGDLGPQTSVRDVIKQRRRR